MLRESLAGGRRHHDVVFTQPFCYIQLTSLDQRGLIDSKVLATSTLLPEVTAESEVDEQFEGRVGDEADVGRPEDVIIHSVENDVAGADEKGEEAGRVEQGVDAEYDARVTYLEVLSVSATIGRKKLE